MKIEVNENLIKHLENLSLIHLNQNEEKMLENDIANIIKFFEKINELDLSNVEPLFHPLPQGRLRKDTPRDPLDRENALKNVKRKENGYIVGPRTYGE
ncbi:MAG: Asp-tRNA(Asn) amidotransferase subunit GatC [Saccharolobus sp.]|uniref:Aspartyl/glutamyl-tRNA(Asn/Gln) amidotransferase subunit C n=1 Tax=Saccharolobus shibatae TaxID=2286 RepID=A0A8F5BWT3_9CREN|nr:Asp-tRNA(Asn) amidotransferase subunit GatC [Saccharolobus shibatae]MCH4815086.1 Asp-tRNA(Asn) amidotransferase subunit GatC [Saccharolobus shibatae]QXJ32877.1 Aspartyl-tRNA(Asn) amidotransferase subunit C amidotransferase subunit C [Saccharolobus shibatae]QXJ36008.1 Aspartyl-tRNA(Asn) amidotransferase subunit C, Glutamyl-tRNA(Gln) amidotransferase subunit C [Saccharolobus shibatae]